MMEFQVSALVRDSDPTSLSTISEKRTRVTWTVELHEKFLDAIEALGGYAGATPERILHLMKVKGLTAKHISSHLQKHRLHHQNANQGGRRQENASRKPISEPIISAHDAATSGPVIPRVETDSGLYPLRLLTEMKKSSMDTAVVKTDMHTCTSGNHIKDKKSVWDKYENDLESLFPQKKKRWQFMSKLRCPWKNNIFITDEGDPNEATKSAGGASEISGSCCLRSDRVGENNRAEADRDNDLREAFRAYLGTSGSGSLLKGDQIRQNSYAEVTRDSENLGTINLLRGYGASIENTGLSSLLTSDQVRQNNLTEAARNNDIMAMGNTNFLEGTVDPVYIASMDVSVDWAHLESNDLDLTDPSDGREGADSFWMSPLERSQEHQSLGPQSFLQVGHNAYNDALRSVELSNVDEPVAQGSQEQQILGMENPLQVDDIAWDDAQIDAGLMNLLNELMGEEATVGGSQNQQSLAPEVLQAGDTAWDDDLRSAGMVNLFAEPIAQEAFIEDAVRDDPMIPIAQDDVLWAWSPMPAVDYGMFL